MSAPLSLKIILGSTRLGRFSELLLPWIQDAIVKQGSFSAEVLDLRDYPLPFYNEATSPSAVVAGAYPSDSARKWADKIREGDAFLIIAPEYNHGYSAVLKNAFDTLSSEWNKKPVAFVAYGGVGGARAVEQLRGVVIDFQMAPISSAVHIFAPKTLREPDGNLKAGVLDGYTPALERTLTNLLWWSEALKVARAQPRA